MAILKQKEIKLMQETELMKKLEDLKLESVKSGKSSQGSSIKNREIKRTIARILTQFAHLRSKSKKDNKK